MSSMGKISCGACGQWVRQKLDGQPYKHPCQPAVAWAPQEEVPDSPAVEAPEKGPWFGALYDGWCSVSECRITEGDRIRADGEGGYECEDCGDTPAAGEEPIVHSPSNWQEQASAAAKRHMAALGQADIVVTCKVNTDHLDGGVGNTPKPDAFDVPSTVTADDLFDLPADPGEKVRKVNVSGQLEPERDYLGRYIVKDPELGDFRWFKNGNKQGITRVTTFNKAAQDSKAINDWGKRNVVIGASLRPDVLRRAHGLRHDNGNEAADKAARDALDRIVAELDTAAGGKVSADEGTYLHEETEKIDAGLQTWEDSPAAYQQDLKRYVEALAAAGLEPIPGLIERTTMISEFGGVCGTFDRIFYHRASGSYVVGDLKTGKTMKYAMDETQTQLWCYAHGVNQNGIYDWNTKTWGPAYHGCECESHVSNETCVGPREIRVREDAAVIVHMPVQGPDAGTLTLLVADLVAGKAHAELCHQIRSRPKPKQVPWASWVAPVPTWEERFADVRDREDATALWKAAKADGVSGIRLEALIQIARDALVGKG